MMPLLRPTFFLACLTTAPAAVRYVHTDVCIYGGTSGGIVAAVAAQRCGRQVVLLEPSQHLGGTTTGGLGRTDVGPFPAAIGGLAAEFYQRVEAKYGSGAVSYVFEPKMASLVYQEMLAAAGVAPLLGQELVSVVKNGASLKELHFASGLVVRAEQFIDTTYEGDLMAAAGVAFRTGREASAEYGESLNGIGNPSAGSGFGGFVIDPYVLPGNAASGLLPGIVDEPLGTAGAADTATQAYNFRLCLVQASNRLPIAAPPNYQAADYELVGRYVAARIAAGGVITLGDLTTGLLHREPLKNGKTDWNANQGMTTDWVGHSSEWATASFPRRREIMKEHENYIRGFLEFIRTDSRIPTAVKTELATWGLPADEFVATQGWPPQLYVREARRLLGRTVLTQGHGLGTVAEPHPIALAVYALDSHACRRLVIGGKPTHEGGFFVVPAQPWGIPLAALLPRPGSVDNLSVTFALSATHAAFSSARMEPVFMSTSHAAAVAACQALELNVALAAVPPAALQATLAAQGQVLDWSGGFASDGLVVEAEGPGAARTGSWSPGANPGFHGLQYLTDGNTGKGAKTYRFTPRVPVAGNYRVAMWWISNANRASNVPVTISHQSGSTPVVVNMQLDPDGNTTPGGWKDLGTYSFAAGANLAVLLETTGTNGFVLADAIRLEPIGFTLRNTVELVPLDPQCQEGTAGETARLAIRRSGPLTASLIVPLTYLGTAQPGTDTPALPASITIPVGAQQAIFSTTALADNLLEGPESLTISLAASSNYDLSTSQATIALEDTAFNTWSHANFTPSEISAGQPLPQLDPDRDGLSNLLEYHLGTLPNQPNATPPAWEISPSGRYLILRRPLRKKPSSVLVEASTTLAGAWQSVAAPLVQTTEAGGFLTETYELPTAAEGRRFYRFRLE